MDMSSSFGSQLKFYLTYRPIWVGLIVGVFLTSAAVWLRPLTLFRYANDPLQLVQPIIQLRFGLINFNWRLPLIHLSFIVSVSLITPLTLRLLGEGNFTVENAVFAVRTASLSSIAYIWWLRVDAIPVIIWYGFSTWISVAIVSWLTRSIVSTFATKKMRVKG